MDQIDQNKFSMLVLSKDELVSAICYINPVKVQNSITRTAYHYQTMMCRLIIYLMKDNVIGSPVFTSKYSICLITSKDYFNSREFKQILEQESLTVASPQPVNNLVYTCSLKFTFEFFLSPNWNKVSQMLIQDEDFLEVPGEKTAIKFNIKVNKKVNVKYDELMMTIDPLKVNIYPFKLTDLCLPPTVVDDFYRNPSGFINVNLYGFKTVAVLPSLRKGKLVGLFKKIPSNCCFKSWDELRRHWRNMYGYKLPRSDEGIIYYQVYFSIKESDGSNCFIYPNICVRDALVQSPYTGDKKVAAKKFVTDLNGVLPKLFDEKLKISKDYSVKSTRKTYETPKFESALTQKNSINNANTITINKPATNAVNDESDKIVDNLKENNVTLKRTNDNFHLDSFKKIKMFHGSSTSTDLKNTLAPSTITSRPSTSTFNYFNKPQSQFLNESNGKSKDLPPINIFKYSKFFKNHEETIESSCSTLKSKSKQLNNQNNILTHNDITKYN